MFSSLAGRRATPLRPMLASLEEPPLVDEQWVYEPKYDGIRALVEVAPAAAGGVTIWSRLGNDKTAQFPEIARALERLAPGLRAPVVLDGEIVAVDAAGEPAGFQRLQGRIHQTSDRHRGSAAAAVPVAFVAFDALREGAEDLRGLPLAARRARLERIFGTTESPLLRLSRLVPGDGRALYRAAVERGHEGLIAKRLGSPYRDGRRSPDWRKLKVQNTASCVVGGWTEPRGSRPHFGALLLGVRRSGALVHVGHTGTGFTQSELARVADLLAPLETSVCPFATRPRTNERPHWVEPRLVAEVRFAEWTDDGKLRHPAYLGLRDDVDPEGPATPPPRPRGARRRGSLDAPAAPTPELAALGERLSALEEAGGSGTVALPGGGRLEVSRLDKLLWRQAQITKGALMRYYVAVSPFILPAVADRPLIMRRYPNGIGASAFYQQRAPADVPPGVRVEVIPGDRVVPSRLVGGSLLTLLYMAQLAGISQDPWFSRVGSLDFPDHAVIDLDPMPGVSFARVLEVARWVHDELERLGVPSVPKTSGAEGLHVYVPLPPGTPYASARLLCQIVATLVAQKHSTTATVERRVGARGRTVYVDYLQNSRGKTLATAYSARATEIGGASAPLTWAEVHAGVDRRDFTLRTLPSRVAVVGDLWARLRTERAADLDAVLERLRG